MNPASPKSAAALILLAAVWLLLGSHDAQARFIKKLTVEPLVNPREWEGLFKPGNALALMLGDALSASGDFQMVHAGTKPRKRRAPQAMPKEETSKKGGAGMMEPAKTMQPMVSAPLSQYRLRGRVLVFDPETDPPPEDLTPDEALRYRERAEVEVLLDVVDSHTGRSLVKKSFLSVSQEGRSPFNRDLDSRDYDRTEFGKTSMGLALRALVRKMESFITDTLQGVPMEGNLIWIDPENKDVVINLGEVNGIRVQDVFTVFGLTRNFVDPLNEADLGDQYTRKGTVKVVEVQGHFSRAKITAGSALAAGDLVSPNPKTILRSRNRKTIPPDPDVLWGAYKGLPSLSY